MKTPEEIKKGLKFLGTTNVTEKVELASQGLAYAYYEDFAADALAYIQQLERERDAAVEQLQTASRPCNSCKYGDEIVENDTVCKECKIVMRNGDFYYDHWQWRGAQEVE